METEKAENKRKVILAVIIAIALLIYGTKFFLESSSGVYPPDCMIEYGHGECVGGYLRIPFYNPNQQDITRVRITVPSGVRTNITLPADFTVNEPLHPGDTGVLTLFPCEEDVNTGGFSMEWCCSEKCYTSKMNQTSEEIEG